MNMKIKSVIASLTMTAFALAAGEHNLTKSSKAWTAVADNSLQQVSLLLVWVVWTCTKCQNRKADINLNFQACSTNGLVAVWQWQSANWQVWL